MSALSPILRSVEGGLLAFHCPGCESTHAVVIRSEPHPCWAWNGDVNRPTFTPSILITGFEPSDVDAEFDDATKDKPFVCHSFVTDGQIQFLGDCTHALAGQTVPLPVLE